MADHYFPFLYKAQDIKKSTESYSFRSRDKWHSGLMEKLRCRVKFGKFIETMYEMKLLMLKVFR